MSLLGEADFHSLVAAHGNVYGYDSTGGRFMVSHDGTHWKTRSHLAIGDFAVDRPTPTTWSCWLAYDVVTQAPHGLVLGAGRRRILDGTTLGDEALGAGPSPAAVVDEAVVGDGEHPGAELRLRAGKGLDALEHRDEHLAGDVVGLECALDPQVSGDGWGQ